jgi:hypothetical protein
MCRMHRSAGQVAVAWSRDESLIYGRKIRPPPSESDQHQHFWSPPGVLRRSTSLHGFRNATDRRTSFGELPIPPPTGRYCSVAHPLFLTATPVPLSPCGARCHREPPSAARSADGVRLGDGDMSIAYRVLGIWGDKEWTRNGQGMDKPTSKFGGSRTCS